MRQLLLVIFAGLTLLSQVAVAQIDRPLNDDQKTFVKAHAPKLILPGCIDWLDRPCALNFDGDWKAWNNYENSEKVKTAPGSFPN